MRHLIGAAGAVVALAVPAAALGATPAPAAGDLYTLDAGGGALTPVPGRPGRYDIRLTGVRTVTALAGQGESRVSLTTPAALSRRWAALGLTRRPPLAALVVPGRPAGSDVAVLRLSRPRIAGGGLVIRAQAVRAAAAGGLAGLIRRADRPAAGAFGSASLVIDASQTEVVSVEIVISGLAQASGFAQIKFTNGAYVNAGFENGQLLAQGATPNQLGPLSTFASGPDTTQANAVSVSLSLGGTPGAGSSLVFSGSAFFPPGVTATADIGGAGARVPIPSGQFDITLQAP